MLTTDPSFRYLAIIVVIFMALGAGQAMRFLATRKRWTQGTTRKNCVIAGSLLGLPATLFVLEFFR